MYGHRAALALEVAGFDCRAADETRAVPAGIHRQAGITLIEVLVAIFISGVGLLALLTLFPLGVQSMAEEIQDDRAAKLANDADAFSKAGEDLLARRRTFVFESLTDGSADAQTAARLRAEFEKLGVQAAGLEERLAELRPLVQRPKTRLQLLASLAEIEAIQAITEKMVRSLRLLEHPNPP